ncbi:hypothetical protein [Sphingosinicella terrae]|uniref:hypothetical protein n=1 Tax=Sphingosinicella terrae TaxID=2172047 RepID=UPI0013B43E28|nr:hypothetical protein [Sphingosinicella terrae]
MTKSATDVMQEIIVSAVLDSFVALKAASKGLPNSLLRDLNAIHANTTFGDLPDEVQKTVAASVRAGFSRLLKEGYSVAPATAAREERRPAPAGQGPRGSGPRSGGQGRGPRPGGGPGGRPGGSGRPGGGGRKPPRRSGS